MLTSHRCRRISRGDLDALLRHGMRWTEERGLSWPEDREVRGLGAASFLHPGGHMCSAPCSRRRHVSTLAVQPTASAQRAAVPHAGRLPFCLPLVCLQVVEEGGCYPGADPSEVSDRAKRRGLKELGSLGSGA